MKHIKSWQERVNEGDSIFAKATALEAEVTELRAYIELQETIHQQQMQLMDRMTRLLAPRY